MAAVSDPATSIGLVASFVAAVQASLSVLLVIFYGGVAGHLKLLNSDSTRAISKVCVRMFLPALLFTKIGSELHAGSAHRYAIVVLWALACHLVSFVIGIAGHLLLGMPDWTTVAVMFNNTTSYPLLLIAALDQTGILQSLVGADETTHVAIERAKSYFLVFSTVSSCLTFAVGPRLIDTEHAPEHDDLEDDDDDDKASDLASSDGDSTAGGGNNNNNSDDTTNPSPPEIFEPVSFLAVASSSSRPRSLMGHDPLSAASSIHSAATEETGLLAPSSNKTIYRATSVVRFIDPFSAPSNAFFPSLRKPTTTLPSASDTATTTTTPLASAQHWAGAAAAATGSTKSLLNRRMSVVPKKRWVLLGPRTRWWLVFIGDFFNAPMLGALVGAVVGLTPSLHRAFFSPQQDGGLFTAWLTASLDDIGGLFVPLPVVVAGVSLYTAMQQTTTRRRSSAAAAAGSLVPSSTLPWDAVSFILAVRFVVWPIVSIWAIHHLAIHSHLLSDDPMLWFALMLMPMGPPAMKLITLVQVSNATEDDETSISKLLTISYLISPILSFAVVGSLRASQAGMEP